MEDAHFFSNVAVNVQCATPLFSLDQLVDRLSGIQLGLDQNDLAPLILAAARSYVSRFRSLPFTKGRF